MSSPSRPSKFIEGSPLTGPDLWTRTPTTTEHFQRVLCEMDEMELEKQKRRHRDSNASSTSSSASSLPSPSSAASLREPEFSGRAQAATTRRSLDGEGKFAAAASVRGGGRHRLGIKGRLRALTVGSGSASPKAGT
ncbi:hypothetical protein B7494_g5974 [Chlorociboria aeruginascens]|nr:hypothetical protein B7494_g5974 [Chlorociboria aeruginascens]